MKKIGIITIPDYNNYGNRLQNYAVKTYFEKKGFAVDTLEMNDELFSKRKERKIKLYLKKFRLTAITFLFELLSKKLSGALRYLRFEKFTRKYLGVRYLPEWNMDFCRSVGEEYDYIVLGSDQIWHPFINTTPNLFFAQFVPPAKRLYFAPSFGIEKLTQEYSDLVRENLKGINKISVREKAGEKILRELTDAEVTVLCDPTLLLSKDEWSRLAVKPKGIPNKYVLSYFLGPVSTEYASAKKEIENTLQCGSYRIADKENKKSYITGPSEFIYSIKNAEFVVTDSFHAVVFSIIFGKPFLVCSRLEDDGLPAGLDSRIDLLLEMFNMTERKFNGNCNTEGLLRPLPNTDSVFEQQKIKADDFFGDPT